MEEAQTMDIDVVSCIPMLRRYALKLARNGPDADDLVQDCLLRALSRQHQFEPGTNLVAWLTTILRNLFFNDCQRKKRMVEVELEPDTVEASLDAPQDHRVELGDTQRALQGLSDVQKQVVQRCGVEGASYEDVAEEMGVSVGTIRSRLSRARSYLREQVAGRIVPSYLRSGSADARTEKTGHYHIRRVGLTVVRAADLPMSQPEACKHRKTPVETELLSRVAGFFTDFSNVAPPGMVKTCVEGAGRILTGCASFPRAFFRAAVSDPGDRWTDTHWCRGSNQLMSWISRTASGATRDDHGRHPSLKSGLAVEQVDSRGGAPPFFSFSNGSGSNFDHRWISCG
jgi:RNA polymerase sigma-70 factor (ECF subfamily)